MSHIVIPNPFEFRFIVCFEIGKHLECLADRILNYLEYPDMTADELRAYADAKTKEIVDSLTATVTAEHDEVMAALATGGGTAGLTDDEIKAAIDSQTTSIRDQLTPLIQGVFDAAAAPAPTPTPAPGPAPAPTPAMATPTPGVPGASVAP